MNKEIFSTRQRMTKLSVTNNEITAILRSDNTKTGLRIYSDGCIGVAGAIGRYDDNKLTQQAKDMLRYKVPYDCSPTEHIVKAVDLSQRFQLSDEQFINTSNEFLNKLKANYPSFSYSHIIRYVDEETALKNNLGTELSYRDKYVSLELLIKHKSSKSLFDGCAVNQTRMYSFEDAYKVASEFCDSYEEKVDIESGSKMPVVLLSDHSLFLSKFYSELHGEKFGTKTSLFYEKIGQKIFADNFSLFVNRNSIDTYASFFDGEGTTLENDQFMLIQNGVLKAPYSSKKIAKKYNLPVTSSASLIYDDVPSTSPSNLNVLSSGKTVKQLLNGKKAIYVIMASGGDFTPQGDYAMPVQAAYLFDGEKIYGRLPQISISSNIYDMFGNDFIGLSTDGYSENSPFKYMIIDMNVKKIGGYM